MTAFPGNNSSAKTDFCLSIRLGKACCRFFAADWRPLRWRHRTIFVWATSSDGSDVLHRVLRAEGDVLDLCGDNQIRVERGVSRGQVLGVMRGFYRGEHYVDAGSAAYRLYVRIWRHLPLRRALLKALRILRKV